MKRQINREEAETEQGLWVDVVVDFDGILVSDIAAMWQRNFERRLKHAGWSVNGYPFEPVWRFEVLDHLVVKCDDDYEQRCVRGLLYSPFLQVARADIPLAIQAINKAGMEVGGDRHIGDAWSICDVLTRRRLEHAGLSERQIVGVMCGNENIPIFVKHLKNDLLKGAESLRGKIEYLNILGEDTSHLLGEFEESFHRCEGRPDTTTADIFLKVTLDELAARGPRALDALHEHCDSERQDEIHPEDISKESAAFFRFWVRRQPVWSHGAALKYESRAWGLGLIWFLFLIAWDSSMDWARRVIRLGSKQQSEKQQ